MVQRPQNLLAELAANINLVVPTSVLLILTDSTLQCETTGLWVDSLWVIILTSQPHLRKGGKAALAVWTAKGLVLCAVCGLVLCQLLRGWEGAITHVAGEECVRLRESNSTAIN